MTAPKRKPRKPRRKDLNKDVVARVTIYGAADMTDQQAHNVYKWLLEEADFFRVGRKEFAKRFVGRRWA